MTFKIKTLGCKVNNYESELIYEKLIKSGYVQTEKNPDIVIINTCSVTNQADSKSMQIIRREKKSNPNGIIVVIGCVIESNRDNLESIPADIIIGNYDKSNILNYIDEFVKTKKQIISLFDLTEKDFEDMLVTEYSNKTRAFIKVQDGCNNFCSYCIIPYLRGRVKSKNFNNAIEEVKLLANTHEEIVLTGIHTGSYNDSNHDLTDLIKEISKIDKVKRIRISSIEITELNDKFLDELKINNKICNHLHIPIQSGSNEILKKMNRKYNKEYFIDKVKKIRSIRPDINLTTDLIVGFPGESEELFKETIDTINLIEFSKIHVFPYSVRKGTVSEKMPNHLPNDVKKERSKIIFNLSTSFENNYAKKFIGKNMNVLIETVKDDISIGHTDNYLEIIIKEPLNQKKQYNVVITEIIDNKLYGKLI